MELPKEIFQRLAASQQFTKKAKANLAESKKVVEQSYNLLNRSYELLKKAKRATRL